MNKFSVKKDLNKVGYFCNTQSKVRGRACQQLIILMFFFINQVNAFY